MAVDNPPKKSTAREVTEAAVSSAAGMVPVVGSPLAVAFAMAMGWSYNERMRAWLDELAAAVTELQDRTDGLTFEDLAQNPVFTDAVINATRAAQATHLAEKLDALRNAVVNSLRPDAPTADEQARFIRLVEQFTPGHLRLLTFLNDPAKAFTDVGRPSPTPMMGGRGNLLEDAMPEFAGRRDWYDLLARDIDAASLAQTNLHATMSGSGLLASATTDLGKRFLQFIEAPPNLDGGATRV